MIQKEDVLPVATFLKVELTEKEIQWVIDNYEAESEMDPSGALPLWIENLIYQVVYLRTKNNLPNWDIK